MGGKKRLTNDEAINVLKNAVLIGAAWIGDEKQFYDLLDAVKMAVEALKRSEIPNCSDAISRQVAISNCKARLYESAVNSIGHECQADEVFRDIAEHRIGTWLEELSPVQPEPQWIPVTERLPEGDTVVLCSIPASDGYIERIAFGYYMRFGNLGWRMSDWLQNHGAYGAMQPEPIAWMPLPEPFREEGENE